MRAVRFTQAEISVIRLHLGSGLELAPATARARERVLTKLAAAEAPADPGVAAGPLEEAMVSAAGGRVVRLSSGPAGYARASKTATQLGVTVEQAEVVGGWLARQGWMREPTTILGVLNKWHEWLPRALATAPAPAAAEGFDGTSTTAGRADRPRRGGGGRGGSEGFR